MSSHSTGSTEHVQAFKELARLSGVDVRESVLDVLVELCLQGRSAGQLLILLNSLIVGTAAGRTSNNNPSRGQ